MLCPHCRTPLRDDAGADVCDRCGGAWFDRGELDQAVAAAAPPSLLPAPPPEPTPQYRKCPRCSTLMARRAYERISGVILDDCNAHGVWLDKGELERIVAFEAGSGPERLAKKLADEARLERARERDWKERWARTRALLTV